MRHQLPLAACADTYLLLDWWVKVDVAYGSSRELDAVKVRNLTARVTGCLGWQVLMHFYDMVDSRREGCLGLIVQATG